VDYSPIAHKALEVLEMVAHWIATTSDDLGLDASHYANGSRQLCGDLTVRWKLGLGLKVPGSRACPLAKAGGGLVGQVRDAPRRQKLTEADCGYDHRRCRRRGSPREVADVGVEVSRVPGGHPDK